MKKLALPSTRMIIAALTCGVSLISMMPAHGQDPYTLPGKAMDSVFLVGYSWENGPMEIVGTAWTIAPSTLATAAHVALSLSEAQMQGARIIARRGLLDKRELVVGTITTHPAYMTWSPRLERMVIRQQNELKNFAALPVADVAVLEVVAGDTGPALECIDPLTEPAAPALGSPVAYLGYPTENLSGFAVLHLTPCSITALTDYFFQRVPWPDAYLIHICGVATGGASGSPVINPQGKVIGILSAAENVTIANDWEASRIPIGYIYAQRIDLAKELLAGDAEAAQLRRNPDWVRRALQVFLPPSELLDQIMEQYGAPAPEGEELVLDSEYTIVEAADSLRVPITLEPGYLYQACALAQDGTDIDGSFLDDEDTAADQYPVLKAGPLADEVRAMVNIWSAEELLGPTAVSLRVFRHAASIADEEEAEGAGSVPDTEAPLLEETIEISEGGEQKIEYTFPVDAQSSYMVYAESTEGRDIDLEVYVDGTFVDADWAYDSQPLVPVSGVSGEITIQVIFPEDTEPGDSAVLWVYPASTSEGGE